MYNYGNSLIQCVKVIWKHRSNSPAQVLLAAMWDQLLEIELRYAEADSLEVSAKEADCWICIFQMPGRGGSAEGTSLAVFGRLCVHWLRIPEPKLQIPAASSAPSTKERQSLIPLLGNSSLWARMMLLAFHPRTAQKVGRVWRALPSQISPQ